MIEKFFVRDVTILHPALVSSGYGGGTDEDFDNATPVSVKGWLSQLLVRRGAELTSSTRDTVVGTFVLRLPVGTAIDERDRVVIDGDTYAVDGTPDRRHRGAHGEHHVRCLLLLIEG